MKSVYFVFLAAILLLSVSAGAIEVHEDQEDITLIMEQGSILEFPLVLLYVHAADEDLVTYGDIEDWVMFGEAKLKSYYIDSDDLEKVVKVTIDIPENVEVGEYHGWIASNNAISEITIRVVPPLGDIQLMKGLETLSEGIQGMIDSLSGDLNATKEDLEAKIAEANQYQQDLNNLRSQLDTVEEENDVLTGQVSGGTTTQFIVGLIVGGLLVVLFLKRGRVAKALSGARRGGSQGYGSGYKGWKQ